MYTCFVDGCWNKGNLTDLTIEAVDIHGNYVKINVLVCHECVKKYFEEKIK